MLSYHLFCQVKLQISSRGFSWSWKIAGRSLASLVTVLQLLHWKKCFSRFSAHSAINYKKGIKKVGYDYDRENMSFVFFLKAGAMLRYLLSFQKDKMCRYINRIPEIMVQLCYLKTILGHWNCLLSSVATDGRMDMGHPRRRWLAGEERKWESTGLSLCVWPFMVVWFLPGGVLPRILDRGVPRRFVNLTLFKD